MSATDTPAAKPPPALSPITAQAVTASLAAFVVAYAFVFGFGSYYLAKLLRKGPEPLEEAVRGRDFDDRLDRKPKRPLSVPDETIEAGASRRPQPAS